LQQAEISLFNLYWLTCPDGENVSGGIFLFGMGQEGKKTIDLTVEQLEEDCVCETAGFINGLKLSQPSYERDQWSDAGWKTESSAYVGTQRWFNENEEWFDSILPIGEDHPPFTGIVFISELNFLTHGCIKHITSQFGYGQNNQIDCYSRFGDEQSTDDWISREVSSLIKNSSTSCNLIPFLDDASRVDGHPSVYGHELHMMDTVLRKQLRCLQEG